MIDDFSSPACPDAFDADVCIIGGGPAGITIAAELANTPWRVCLLEGGGLRSERASQALNAGETVGPHPLDPAFSRLRTFGGSTRLWGGGCIPLSSIEMARREWVPESGWPIEWDALAPYYVRANKVCRVDPGDFGDGTYLSSGNGDAPSPNLDNRTSRISPLDFGQAHLELLRSSPNLQLVLHACWRTPPEEPPESAAFLEITEIDPDTADRRVFNGWMFASSPAVNPLEHGVYDVWVMECEEPLE